MNIQYGGDRRRQRDLAGRRRTAWASIPISSSPSGAPRRVRPRRSAAAASCAWSASSSRSSTARSSASGVGCPSASAAGSAASAPRTRGARRPPGAVGELPDVVGAHPPGGRGRRWYRCRRMFAGIFDGPEVIIVLVVVLVLFGGSQIPKLARNLGQAQKEFKKGLDQGAKDDEEHPDRREVSVGDQIVDSLNEPATPTWPARSQRPCGRGAPVRGGEISWSGRSAHDECETAPLQDPAPLTLGSAAPHAVVDAVLEGVLEAVRADRAGGADAPGTVHADAVAGEEHRRRVAPAVARWPSSSSRCRRRAWVYVLSIHAGSARHRKPSVVHLN